MDLRKFLISFSRILPFLVFGLIHFRRIKGVYLALMFWFIDWGAGIGHHTAPFNNIKNGVFRIVGIRDPLIWRVPNGEQSYKLIYPFQQIYYQSIVVLEVLIFWWVYNSISNGKDILKNLMTIPNNPNINRVTYSIIYWSMRLFLFVAGLGVATYLSRMASLGFNVFSSLRVLVYSLSIIIVAFIYRNFLVSWSVSRGRYPRGTYFLLNLPVINLFVWAYSLFNYRKPYVAPNKADDSVTEYVKSRFIQEGKNGGLKIILMLFFFISSLYQLHRAGFRIDGPSREGADLLAYMLCFSFFFVLWYLYDHKATAVLLVMTCLGLLLPTIFGYQGLQTIVMGSTIINIIVYFGLFHFDHLKWDIVSKELTEEE